MQPHLLLDTLKESKNLRTDAELADALGVRTGTVSKVRAGHNLIGDTLRVAIQRKFGWSLSRLDKLAPPTEK